MKHINHKLIYLLLLTSSLNNLNAQGIPQTALLLKKKTIESIDTTEKKRFFKKVF